MSYTLYIFSDLCMGTYRIQFAPLFCEATFVWFFFGNIYWGQLLPENPICYGIWKCHHWGMNLAKSLSAVIVNQYL
ncbi:hypothetical protein XENTR_v10016748 [Xenopus tropicalis]|nr:hypothetical protein XENTR_v10016748 [Xenopus tropicalis]